MKVVHDGTDSLNRGTQMSKFISSSSSKPKNQTTIFLLAAITIAALAAGCSPAKFQMNGQEKGDNGALSDPATPVICDPFSPANIVDPKAGLSGSIYTIDAKQPRYKSSRDYIKYGAELNANLFLDRVYVPTRDFSTGFATSNSTLQDATGATLVEYFGLKLKSTVKLAASDTEGKYQFALLSDDGASMFQVKANGDLEKIVENEGDHSTGLGCATAGIEFTKSSRLPVEISYYQGPRYSIAMVMLWRKVPAAGLSDSACGTSGGDYFDTSTGADRPAFTALKKRGWKPLEAGNFELTSGSNLCAVSQ